MLNQQAGFSETETPLTAHSQQLSATRKSKSRTLIRTQLTGVQVVSLSLGMVRPHRVEEDLEGQDDNFTVP